VEKTNLLIHKLKGFEFFVFFVILGILAGFKKV